MLSAVSSVQSRYQGVAVQTNILNRLIQETFGDAKQVWVAMRFEVILEFCFVRQKTMQVDMHYRKNDVKGRQHRLGLTRVATWRLPLAGILLNAELALRDGMQRSRSSSSQTTGGRRLGPLI